MHLVIITSCDTNYLVIDQYYYRVLLHSCFKLVLAITLPSITIHSMTNYACVTQTFCSLRAKLCNTNVCYCTVEICNSQSLYKCIHCYDVYKLTWIYAYDNTTPIHCTLLTHSKAPTYHYKPLTELLHDDPCMTVKDAVN